jgi:kojibiose phosphorylase
MKIPEHSRDLIYTDWTLIEEGFDPEQLPTRETVFTIGNGYLGTRGSDDLQTKLDQRALKK